MFNTPTGRYLSTAQAGEFLGVTPSRIHRLVRDGFLEVKDTRFYKFGKNYYFDRTDVERLLPRIPEIKRKWQAEEDARLGAKRAAFKRLNAEKKAREYQHVKEQFFLSLEHYLEKSATLLKASFYLYHLNHYAKGGEDYLYDLKEKVLRKFTEKFSAEEGLEILFVEGGQKISLCDSCRQKALKMGLDYIRYKSAYGGCPRCKKRSDYYSLFEFRVRYGEHSFCFHTPYYVARNWINVPSGLPHKTRARGKEEGRAFGRPISEAEAMAVSLEEVIGELERFLGDRPEEG
jgi:hypothetical protein